MDVCVIGSNSFSGSYFVSHLLKKELSVLGISRSEEQVVPYTPYDWLSNREKSGFLFQKIDLNHDMDRLDSLLRLKKPKIVVNFSALGMVAESWKAPCDWYQTNVVAQVALHEILRKYDWLERYVHVTTPEVYGSQDSWISENDDFNPTTPYAASRAACDMHLKTFFTAYGFPVVFTRSANVYGPGQPLYRIIPRTVRAIKDSHAPLQLHGGGESTRCFIHMEDVASATLAVAYRGKVGESYHISSQTPVSIADLVAKIVKNFNCDVADVVNIEAERLGKDQAYLLDSTKIRDQLGWCDQISLETGLQSVYEWFEKFSGALIAMPHQYVHKK